MDFYAHTLPNRSSEEWEHVEHHLIVVAKLAKEFAGQWHDLGKFSVEFQNYLSARAVEADAHLE